MVPRPLHRSMRPQRRQRRHHLPCLCLSTLVLAGCALPTAQQPPAAVPPTTPLRWDAPLPHGANTQQLGQWWNQLGDPLLAELVVAAQDANPTLAGAQARILQSRATRDITAAATAPTLDGSVGLQRSRSQPQTPPATGLSGTLQAGWEWDLFGARRLATEAAQARLAGAEAGWHEARVSVAAETAAQYFRQRACEQQVQITAMDAASRTQTFRLTTLSMNAGFSAPATEALARASAADANGRLTAQRGLCAQDIAALSALTGWSAETLRQRLATAPIDLAPQTSLGIMTVPAAALAQRPDLYRAEREIVAASAEAGSADADRYPRLSLSGNIGVIAFRGSGESGRMATWSLGPLALSIPLADGGRRDAELRAAQARYDEAVANYRGLVRDAVREVEQALLRLASTEQQADDATTAEAGYRQWLAATQRRYDNGLASLMELEETRRTALQAANTLLALRNERIQAWVALYRAMGGGWSAPQQPPAAPPPRP